MIYKRVVSCSIISCFVFLSFLSYGQEVKYKSYLNKADSLIFIQDILGSLKYIDSARSAYNGSESYVLEGMLYRDTLLRTFTEGQGEDSVIIKKAEQIVKSFSEKDFSNQTKVYYLSYFIEALIQERKDPDFIEEMCDLAIHLFEENRNERELRDSMSLVYILHNRGNLYTKSGRSTKAKEDIRRALSINERHPKKDDNLQGVMLYNLSNAYYYDDDEVGAFKILEEAERVFSSIENPNIDYSRAIYTDLGTYYSKVGFTKKADYYLHKSLKFFEANMEEMMAVKRQTAEEIYLHYCYLFLYNLANAQDKDSGINVEDAFSWLERAEQYFKMVEKNQSNRIVMGAVYNFMGEIHVAFENGQGNIEAIKYYRKALTALNDNNNLQRTLQYKFNISKAYLNSRAFESCIQEIDDVILKGKSINDGRLPYFYTMKAHALIRKGEIEESIKIYEKVFNQVDQNDYTISLRERQNPDQYKPNAGLVDAFLIGGSGVYINDSIVGNEKTWILALNMIQFGLKQFEVNFYQDKISKYANREYHKMLASLYDIQKKLGENLISNGDLLTYSEKTNSKYLWEKFIENNQDLSLIDEDVIKKERDLRSSLTAEKRIFQEIKNDSIERLIFDIETELKVLLAEKKERYPSFYKYSEYEFDIASFQNDLEEKDLILKYEKIKENLYRFSINKTEVDVIDLGPYEEFKPSLDLVIDHTRAPKSELSQFNEELENLYDLLIAGSEIKNRNIYFITCEALNHIPFELLRKGGKYLFEDNLISYESSLSLMNLKGEQSVVKNAGIFAPSYNTYTLSPQQLAVRGAAYNLEGAIEESIAISEVINAKAILKSEASKVNFVSTAEEYDLLHLSMHSFLNDEDPELSSLVFHDNNEENELYISELYGMNLRASMAVLSACNTGVGQEKTGEGVVSMTRAFTYAGVPAIVSSLWSAPDKATKQIMTSFYKELKKGKSKTEALQLAKLNYINNQTIEELKHPFYWAGFVLHGNTDPLKFQGISSSSKLTFFLIGLGIFVLLMIGLRIAKSRN